MAIIRLNLEVDNKGDAALKQAASGLDGVGKSAGNADKQLKEFTKSQQNAAMRMQRLHDEALKMNQGFKDSEGKAQLMAGALGTMSTTAAQAASALGLPIGKLSELTGLFGATESALGRTTKGLIGFSGVLVGAIGAALAFGAALGTWAREIPIVTKYADDLAESLRDIARVHLENLKLKGLADWLLGAGTTTSGGPIDAARGAEAVVDGMMRAGQSLAQIRQHFKEMPPDVEKYIASLERFNDEQERLGKIADDDAKFLKKEAEAAAKAAAAAEKAAAAHARALDLVYDAHVRLRAAQKEAGWDVFKLNVALITDELEKQERAIDKVREAEKRLREIREANAEEEQKRDQAILAGKRELADSFLDLGAEAGGVFGELATLAGGVFHAVLNVNDEALRGTSIWQKFGGVVQAAMAAFKSGSFLGGAASGAMAGAQFGVTGAIVGGIGGGLLGLLGGAFGRQQEHMRVNDLRDAFFGAAGGFEALAKKLAETGQQGLVQKIFDTKTVKDFEAAVKEAQAALDMQNVAQQRLNEAMDRYGISIEDMGAKFAQQKLDEQALQLWADWELLNAAMADTGVTLTKMAPSMQEYIDTARKAGATIPSELRAIIEQMIALGLLTDENGVAFENLEDAGLKFGGSLEDSMEDAADAIRDLVELLRTLYGLPPIDIPVTVGGGPAPEPEEGGRRRRRREDHAAGWAAITDWGVPAMLHGTPSNPEYVLRGDQLGAIVDAAVGKAVSIAMAGGGDGGAQVHHHHVHLDGREIASFVTKGTEQGTVRVHPKAMGRGW